MSRTDLGRTVRLFYSAIKYAVLPTLVLANPTKTTHVDFAHIDQGLTISIEEASPPLALLEDERIPVLLPGGEKLQDQSALNQIQVGNVDMSARLESLIQKQSVKIEVLKTAELTLEATAKTVPEPILMASSIIQMPKNAPEVEPATKGDRVPAFGEAFRPHTKTKSADSEPSQPSNSEDMLIDTMTAARQPVSSFRRVASIDVDTDSPVLKNNVETAIATTPKLAKSENTHAYSNNGEVLELEGLIELTKGLAVTDRHQLKVNLMFANHQINSAEVNVSKGSYKIKKPSDGEGMLVADLVDPSGRLVGRGESSVAEVMRDPTHRLYVSPIFGALFGKVNDVYGKPVASSEVRFSNTEIKAKVSKSGDYAFESVMADSQVILSTSKVGYWGTRVVSEVASAVNVNLFPNRMIEALHQLSGTEIDIDKGIIWGKVESSGLPVSGASVELTDANAVGPIYFNQMMLPDKSLTQTSSNGLFAYLRVYPGVHALKTTNRGKEFPSRIVSVESSHVSPTTLEIANTATGRVLVFDALDGEPLEADVRIAGSLKEARTDQGQVGLRYYKGKDLMFVEADAGPTHYVGRITVPRTANIFKIPMIRKAWLEEISGQARISRAPSAGTIVGFVQGDDFTVGLPSHLISAEIIYFDANGRYVGKEVGPAGGGFAIFNAEAGLQQISVLPLGGGGFASKVVHSDSAGVHLINVKF